MKARQVTILLVGLTLLLVGCGPTQPTTTPLAVATPTALPTDTPVPTAAPIPSSPTPAPVRHPGWTSYTNANYVHDMAFDHDGNLWAVGSGGAVKWNLAAGTYTKYTTGDGLADNLVYSVAVALDGVVWFGTGDGVSRFDGRTWTTYYTTFSTSDCLTWTTHTEDHGLLDNPVYSVAVASDGSLWAGTEFCGISRFDGETWTIYRELEGLVHGYGGSPRSIAVAPDGTLWFGTNGGGVLHFDGEMWTVYTTHDGLAHNSVFSIAVAPDGVLWVGTLWGVSRFDGQTWTTYTKDDGLAQNIAYSIAVAPDGALWFGTESGGVSRFDGQTWTTYTTDDGLAHNSVSSIAVAPDGALWFGTHGGVSRFDGQTWTTYTTRDGLADNYVESIAVAPDGVLWVVPPDFVRGGVSRFDGQTWTTYTTKDGLAHSIVDSIAVTRDGTAWFQTRAGLSRYDGNQWGTYSSLEEAIEANYATILTGITSGCALWVIQPPDKVWLASDLVKVYDGNQWGTYSSLEEAIEANYATILTTISSGCALWVIQPPDKVWLTSGPVKVYDGQTWITYTKDDGLADDNVLSIAVAPDGALWFCTRGGVSRYSPPN